MAHILLFEVPGGNDFTVLEDALADGHVVTFLTGDVARYTAMGEPVRATLSRFRQIIEISPYDYAALERLVRAAHARTPFDALICILDIRIIDASLLAHALGLRFLSVDCARLARDKYNVRKRLACFGVRQPRFALAQSAQDLPRAVSHVGYPAVVKPADGYGSQNVHILRSDADLDALVDALERSCETPLDYGLGVRANNRLSVEQFIEGNLVGCDIFSDGDERLLLGVNDKRMYPPPSFAIRGSCFPTDRFDRAALERYSFSILDAMGFNFGAAHIEMVVTEEGPWLIEVNPRLVSAQIPFQMAYAFERSIYSDLINLHLGQPVGSIRGLPAPWFSAIRWIVADRHARLEGVDLPRQIDRQVRRVVLFKEAGDMVAPALSNADRLGYVIAVGETQPQAEQIADEYVAGCRVRLG